MPDNNGNGGKRMNKLEQKDAVQDVKLDLLVKQSGEIHGMLAEALPQVVRNEERIKASQAWITALWGVDLLLLAAIIKVKFF